MRQREIQQVAGKGGLNGGGCCTQAAIVGFGAGHGVLDVGVAGAAEIGAGIRPVDRPAGCGHDPGLYGLRIGIVTGLVGDAAVLRGDGNTAIGLGGDR